jgi:hypothetical protein
MESRTESPPQFWKWLLLCSELTLVVGIVAERFGPLARHHTIASGLLGILTVTAWVFLFFGSPFLLRHQRRLAFSGWCMAVGALLYSAS